MAYYNVVSHRVCELYVNTAVIICLRKMQGSGLDADERREESWRPGVAHGSLVLLDRRHATSVPGKRFRRGNEDKTHSSFLGKW